MTDSYTYKYPRPALTADCVIFGFDGQALKLLLIERGIEPYKGYWALPGGFMRMDETIDECARRELMEETGIRDIYIEQFRVFSATDRDPRGRVVTVAFVALVRPEAYRIAAGDDANNAMWFDSNELPPLAFDHEAIIKAAHEHLREILRVRPIAFNLLDKVFTIDELRRVYEAINNTTYDRRNFSRKVMQSGMIVDANACDDDYACNDDDACDDADACIISVTKECRSLKSATRHRRLFSFCDNKNPEDSDDGSTKDIFNF